MGSLLEQIDDPAALRKLERSALPQLARELRAFVLGTVAQTGAVPGENSATAVGPSGESSSR